MIINPFEYKIPIIWLDTNVIIEMARADKGQIIGAERERIEKIQNLIYKLVREGVLICVEGEQSEEFSNSPSIRDACDKIITDLSLGVSAHHPMHTKRFQIHKMIRYYFDKSKLFQLQVEDIFTEDPREEIERAERTGIIVTVGRHHSKEDIDNRLQTRDALAKEFERIRSETKAGNKEYRDQLNDEFLAESEVFKKIMAQSLARRIKGIQPTEAEFWQEYNILGEPITIWKYASGREFDINDYLNFCNSDEYRSIPYIEINAKLSAAILTERDRKISKTDYMDIKQITAILPYVDYVITDGNLKERLKQLKIGGFNKAKIWSLKDADEIIKTLGQLSKRKANI